MTTYQLAIDIPGAEPLWMDVTKAEWIAVERKCGFRGSSAVEPATGGFSAGGVRGRILYEDAS